MAPIENVIVFGSGTIGTGIIHELLESKKFRVTAVTRDGKSKNLPSSVKIVQTDYSPASLEQALQGQDAVISTLPPPGLQYEPAIVDAAVKIGVKRFFNSEWGNDTTLKVLSDRVPVFATKAKNLQYAASKQKDGFTWTGVQTGPFTEFGLKFGSLGANLKDQTIQFWDSGEKKFDTTTLVQTGKAVVAILSPENFDSTSNQIVRIHSFAITQRELKASLERVTGQVYSVNQTAAAETREAAQKAIDGGNEHAIYDMVKGSSFGDDGLGLFADNGHEVWNKRLGLPQESLDEVIRKFIGDRKT